ncbi:U3 small nucleolar RNA-associated protein 18 -like protein [Trichinella spiralis]|uniref:U3 small nucleolar RNA-associated protein 18-like protein n=1 Tax=Trichinella spiralis TaxID=6334 RepID=A0A0V1BF96_TRISP|nr:U3 small nucleolar RNA-associated protein 18 -like protein [Trichinella spiralis]
MENKIVADAKVQSELQHAVISALENEVDAELARLENLDDEVLQQYRQKRLQELKAEEKERENWRLCRHGEYTEVSERELFDFGNRSKRFIVHFYRDSTMRCKILDKHLQLLAAKHIESKFCKLNVEKSDYIVKKLNIFVIPTLALFLHGKAVFYIRGFDEFGGTDDFTTETVEAVLAERNLIFSTDGTHGFTKQLAKTKMAPRSIRSGTNYGDIKQFRKCVFIFCNCTVDSRILLPLYFEIWAICSSPMSASVNMIGGNQRKKKNRKNRHEKLLETLEKAVLGGKQGSLDDLDAIAASDDIDEDSLLVPTTSERERAVVMDDSEERNSAWVDEDDLDKVNLLDQPARLVNKMHIRGETEFGGEAYSERLKRTFEKVTHTKTCPAWASNVKRKRRSSDNEESSEDEADVFVRSTGKCLGKTEVLLSKKLSCKRLRDLIFEEGKQKRNSFVHSVEFHRESQVLLVSKRGSEINLYQIDGKENNSLHRATFEQYTVDKAHFSADGGWIIVGSALYDHFYYFDMHAGKIVKVRPINGVTKSKENCEFLPSPDGKVIALFGRWGQIYVVSARTFELMWTLKLNDSVRSAAFSSDGSHLYTYSKDGNVYIWDMAMQNYFQKFPDSGCVSGLSIAISQNSNYLACGSSVGVVNLYSAESALQTAQPKLLKGISNLTTAADLLRFNGSSEILAMGSSKKPNALKLLHVQSKTVFENFPMSTCKLGNVKCVDFSPNGGYMCVGNNSGRAMLFRMLHYESY